MADVALVPERDVLQRGGRIGAHEARQAGQVLGENRVPLVGHGGRALLAGAEWLLGLEHLGALQVPDLHRDLLDRARRDGQGAEELCMAVALNHLGGDGSRAKPEGFTHPGLHRGRHIGEGPHGTRDLSHADRLPGPPHALQVALHLGEPQGDLHSEGDRLGVNAVAAAYHHGAAMLEGRLLQDLEQGFQVPDDDVGRVPELEGKGRVENIRGGQAHVDVPGLGADLLSHGGEEGDDIMSRGLLDLVDAADIEVRTLADRLHRLGRYLPILGVGLTDGELHVQPPPVLILLGPELLHLGPGIALDHLFAPNS